MTTTSPNLDATDLQILGIMLEDASLSFKEIGGMVHLTGQAVGSRVRRLQDLGVIKASPCAGIRSESASRSMPLLRYS